MIFALKSYQTALKSHPYLHTKFLPPELIQISITKPQRTVSFNTSKKKPNNPLYPQISFLTGTHFVFLQYKYTLWVYTDLVGH